MWEYFICSVNTYFVFFVIVFLHCLNRTNTENISKYLCYMVKKTRGGVKMLLKSFLLLLFWTVASLASDHNSWKMNVPRLLLPLTEEGTSFKLFSKGGCFTWKSTRPEVVICHSTILSWNYNSQFCCAWVFAQ